MTGLRDFELMILDQIQNIISSEIADNIWLFFTHIGDIGIIWLIFAVILIAFPKTRQIGLISLTSILLSFLITDLILKNVFTRARPYNYRDLTLLIKTPSDYSFPSGHTSVAFAFAFVLLREKFTLGRFKVYIPIIILAALVSFSRLYLYVHFPTDVLAGVLVGYTCAVIAYKMRDLIIKNKNSKN